MVQHSTGGPFSLSPNPPGQGDKLSEIKGLAMSGGSGGWAVGFSDGVAQILRWNGATWSNVPNPPGGSTGVYSGVAIVGLGAWAIGGNARGTLVAHVSC